MALTGENFKRINRSNSDVRILRDKLEEARIKLHYYLKDNEYNFDQKALRLEKEIELAEHNLHCAEYEDNRRRNWK
jgi:hypothetical protein